MALGVSQSTTTSYADVYLATTPATAPGALATANMLITGDTGSFRVTWASGVTQVVNVTVDTQLVLTPIVGTPLNNPITRIEVIGTAGGGTACVNPTQFV